MVKKVKTGAIIQARLASTRLQGKVLLPIPYPNGKPIIKHIVDTIIRSELISYITIATSKNSENDTIEQFAVNENINCYRGSEDNVLSRFIYITQKEELQTVIRLTGDNPLIALRELEYAIHIHHNNNNDYTKTTGLPLGMNLEIIDAGALLSLKDKNLTAEDREHVTKFINESTDYKKEVIKFDYPQLTHLRCTIDYASDFTMMNLLLECINMNNNIIDELLLAIQKMPWLKESNQNNYQLKYYNSISDEIELAKKLLATYGLNHTLEYLNSKAIN